jgi:WD40-like Beta Propeller Repeat
VTAASAKAQPGPDALDRRLEGIEDEKQELLMPRPNLKLVLPALLALGLGAAPAHATYPGQNGKIFFEATVSGSSYDIYSINPDGSGLDNVTDSLTGPPGLPDSAFDPSVSADGRRVALSVDTQANSQIWIINADGTHPLQLTNDNLLDQEPAISPDGSWVAWNQWSPFPSYTDRDVWVMNSNGANQQLLFDGAGTDLWPQFTPDGQTVVMEAETGDEDVRRIPFAPGGPPLTLPDSTPVAADDALLESQPAVSPDGTRVAFTQRPTAMPLDPFDIFSVSINGGGTTPIANSATVTETDPAYSPDGTKIIYSRDGVATMANADGSGATPFSIGGFVALGDFDWAPAVAPPEPEPEQADAAAPDTQIIKHPKNKTRKKKATFEFTSSESGSTFNCVLDGKEQFKACTSPLTVKVKKGKHTFSVTAIDAAGNADPAPATDDWKVKKRKR